MSTLASLPIPRGHLHREASRFTPGPYHVSAAGARVRSIKSAGGRTITMCSSHNDMGPNVRRPLSYWSLRRIFSLNCGRLSSVVPVVKTRTASIGGVARNPRVPVPDVPRL